VDVLQHAEMAADKEARSATYSAGAAPQQWEWEAEPATHLCDLWAELPVELGSTQGLRLSRLHLMLCLETLCLGLCCFSLKLQARAATAEQVSRRLRKKPGRLSSQAKHLR
jgi:hypothetical protein